MWLCKLEIALLTIKHTYKNARLYKPVILFGFIWIKKKKISTCV